MVAMPNVRKTGLEPDDEIALVAWGDAVRVLRLAVVSCIAWLLPVRFWPVVCRALARLDVRMRRDEMGRRTREIATAAGGIDGFDAEAAVGESMVARCEAQLLQFRCYWSDGWQPVMRVEGSQYVEDALAQGKGVILWVANFIYSDLVTKMALDQSGYRVTHLSRSSHGFSSTRFGIRFLNPLQQAIEDRFIRERVVVEEGGLVPALMALRRRLLENGLVSITVGAHALRLIETPFLNGVLQLSSGPAELAQMTGAALLPVVTLKDGPMTFTTRIGAPLNQECDGDTSSLETVASTYAEQFEPVVRRHGAYWNSWYMVKPGGC